jgi:hypothetical protein
LEVFSGVGHLEGQFKPVALCDLGEVVVCETVVAGGQSGDVLEGYQFEVLEGKADGEVLLAGEEGALEGGLDDVFVGAGEVAFEGGVDQFGEDAVLVAEDFKQFLVVGEVDELLHGFLGEDKVHVPESFGDHEGDVVLIDLTEEVLPDFVLMDIAYHNFLEFFELFVVVLGGEKIPCFHCTLDLGRPVQLFA